MLSSIVTPSSLSRSRSQPEGVHGPSQIIDHSLFPWDDTAWKGIPVDEYVIYELHVGTFTPEGTFEALAGCLDYLKELGVTAIEIMPVGQFPGDRNWGYDGRATANSWGDVWVGCTHNDLSSNAWTSY